MRKPGMHMLLPCLAAAAGLGLATGAMAQDSDATARAAVKAMTDFLSAQQAFAVEFDTSLEAVTPDFEKIQFNSSGHVEVVRPDRIHMARRGGFADVEATFDGQALTVLDKDRNRYAVVPMGGTVDELFDRLPAERGVGMPAIDLIREGGHDALMGGVVLASHIGDAVVGGVDSQYYAFRTDNIDWQVWIANGDQPVPMKFVVTTKHIAQAPQYTIQFRNWQFGDAVDAGDEIALGDAEKVDFTVLSDIDELPAEGDGQ